MRELDIDFESDGVTIRGWLYLPEGDGPFPGVIAQPGFGGHTAVFRDPNGANNDPPMYSPYQEVFTAGGIATLIIDPPNVGTSGGEPRDEINPFAWCRAIQDGITFVQLRDEVDEDRIGLWGVSYSGGHVLHVASMDHRVKAVVSQAMTISGRSNLIRRNSPQQYAELVEKFTEDRKRRMRGEPELLATYPAGDVVSERGPHVHTIRTFEYYDHYEPAAFIERVSPAALLMIVPTGDILTPAEDALTAYQRALEPKKLLLVPGGHYTVYNEHYELTSTAARDWFLEHL
jgi:fermentation-respiration switch protein FrsA (DUF1100 family)